MLNLITLGWNSEYLEVLYKSIPKEDDVKWHIIFQSDELYENYWRNPLNIVKYRLSDELTNTEKLNQVLEKIEDHFMILDCDTTFNENAYKIYRKYQDFDGILIGNQIYYNGSLRMKGIYPSAAGIDSGNVICSSSCLKECKWLKDEKIMPDYYFWLKCFEYYGKERTILIDEPLSTYNSQIFQTIG